MIGAGEAFFAAYALSQGLGEVLAGFVVGLPIMMGATLQTATPYLFFQWPRPKRWVMITATLQAVMLLALMATTLAKEPVSPVLIFVLIGLYWAFSYSSSSVWNYWMGFLVPEAERPKFFAWRGQLMQIGVIAGLAVGGVFLHVLDNRDLGVRAYAMPFLIAFLARCLAVYLMGGQSQVEYQEQVKPRVGAWGALIGGLDLLRGFGFLREAWRVFQENAQARKDLTFLFLFNCAIFISSSFVTPFLLAKLKFGYMSFMASQMALFVGKIIALLFAAKRIEKWGVRRVMFIGALGMSPLSAFWFFVERTISAVALQGISGFFWGLFEVAVTLVLFSELPRQNKIQLLTWNSFFQAIAILLGTLVGGQILAMYDEMIYGYLVIFILGAMTRTLLVLAHRPSPQGT